MNHKIPKALLLTPLVLATTITFANWGSNSEEINSNNVTTNDEDRAAFINLSKMVAAGDVEPPFGPATPVTETQFFDLLILLRLFTIAKQH